MVAIGDLKPRFARTDPDPGDGGEQREGQRGLQLGRAPHRMIEHELDKQGERDATQHTRPQSHPGNLHPLALTRSGRRG